MLWIEEKYINFLGHKLKLFKKVKHNQWSFRCPICGDSKSNAYKARGGFYLHSRATSYTMGCFNCGASMSFSRFLKLQDPYLYNEYTIELYKAKQDLTSHIPSIDNQLKDKPNKKLKLSNLECISDLDPNHPAVKYLVKRKISSKHWDKLYFVLRFKKWELEWRNENVKDIKDEHPRLIIPFFDKQGNITRISARSFGNENPKYIYMKVKDDASRVYGLDTVNPSKRVYVLEGPIDSLFIDNSIAVGSADLIVNELKEYNDCVLVPDNQPRNPEVCKSIKKMVDSGHNVCLWDTYWGKDINEMILNGHTEDEIKNLINKSTVHGIQAKLKFANWVKVKI